MKHHYVPVFHLKEFTRCGCEDNPIYVLDKILKRGWTRTPLSVACEHDFYRVDEVDATDPHVVEKTFAREFEPKWRHVTRKIIEGDTMPGQLGLRDLLKFVAFSAARVPHLRQAFLEELKEDNTTEEDIDTKSTGHRRYELDLMDEMAKRIYFIIQSWHWHLCAVSNGSPDLICSDVPVCLTHRDKGARTPAYAYGVGDRFLTFPLGKRHLLVARPEGDAVMDWLDTELVAITNGRTALRARQVFSGEQDFVWLNNQGTVAYAEDFKVAFGIA
jgi:hypothetical protein